MPHFTSQPSSHLGTPAYDYIISAAVIAICTLVALVIGEHIDPTNLVMIYLVGVVYVAAHQGRMPSIFACLFAVSSLNFFFVEPYYSFSVMDDKYYITFAFFVLASLIASSVAVKLRLQTENTRRQNNELQSLYASANALASCYDYDSIAGAAAAQLEKVFACNAAIWLPNEQGMLQAMGHGATFNDEAAKWAYTHKQACGADTQTFPSDPSYYLPLIMHDKAIGVLALNRQYNPTLLSAYISLITGAVARANASYESRRHLHESERQKLRNTLLSAVGHDLRTPLATITGAASSLVSQEGLNQAASSMAISIEKEASRLNTLVHNILEVTRLEAGALSLNREPYFINELVGSALKHCQQALQNHALKLKLEKDLPLLNIDGVLIQQVFTNLLENAARHTPEQGQIIISASQTPYAVEINISDTGQGIPAGQESIIFERYKRLADSKTDGMGLGLAICKAIIEAHGGNIWACNGPQGGASFTFTLPLPFNKADIESATP